MPRRPLLGSAPIRVALAALLCVGAASAGTAAALGALTAGGAPTTTTIDGASPVGLHGVVGPGFTISFSYSDTGAPVSSLNPGTYSVQIDDLANNHNFHLTGAGVDDSTTVADVGISHWSVKLQPGTYMFVCDPHASTMTGQLLVLPYTTVTSFPAPAPTPKKKSKTKH